MAPRPFSVFRTRDQWLRAAHAHTAIDPATGGVQLARLPDPGQVAPATASQLLGAGLAFDPACRLFHSLQDDGRVERILWAARDPLAAGPSRAEPLDIFEGARSDVGGEFATVGPPTGPLRGPRGLAVDEDGRLFIAEAGARSILVVDLTDRVVVRRVALPGGVQGPPVDLAAHDRTVWVVGPRDALVRLTARSGPQRIAVRLSPGSIPAASRWRRIAIAPSGEIALLARGSAGRADVAWLRPDDEIDRDGGVRHVLTVSRTVRADDATDIEFQEDGLLVVARMPGQDLLRWRDGIEDDPLKAKGYDGLGIVRTPDCRIGFWTERGFRHAVAARRRFVTAGRVTTYALDSGTYQTQWGRIFLDACIPDGTRVRVHAAASDDIPDGPSLPRTGPENVADVAILRPDLSPALVPLSLAPRPADSGSPVVRRLEGREIPWSRPAPDDPFVTYDGQIQASPGRYLWVTLDLRSDGAATPRIRSIRVERPGHDLMRRLPRLYSRDERAEAFLRRFLATVDGELTQLDGEASERRALLDPMSAPSEILPWLADFVGLVLDERWPIARRRALVAEAVTLFRFRGTLPGLLRFLEICLGVRPTIVEAFRLRGLGGAVLGQPGLDAASAPVVGAGFRVGGAVAGPDETLDPATVTPNAFATTAHRFTVIIPAEMSDEQLAATAHLLDVHRPAHTLYELCTVGAGIRVGIGIHLGLSTIVGRTGGFDQLQLGASTLGTTGIIGRPHLGTRLAASVLGHDSRVG